MGYSIAPLERLIEQFENIPTIGHKSAQRIAYHILDMEVDKADLLCEAIKDAKNNIKLCECCQNLTDLAVCPICQSEARDKSVICVVEDPRDVIAFERTREFDGQYHVLHGVISPLDGKTPDQLKIKELLKRLQDDTVKEIIIATNPTVDGEATASYLSRLLKPLGVKVSRLAYGIPVGGSLEFADEITISRALEGRTTL